MSGSGRRRSLVDNANGPYCDISQIIRNKTDQEFGRRRAFLGAGFPITCIYHDPPELSHFKPLLKESDHHDDATTGCSLRVAAVAEDTGVHGDGSVDTGAGDWCECGDLHAGECGAAEKAAGC